MTLKLTTKTTHYVDYYDLEVYLTEKIGKKVEIIGSPNDTDYNFEATPLDPTGSMYVYDMEEVENFLETGVINMEYGYSGLYTVMNYACTQGWIEPGHYSMTVSW